MNELYSQRLPALPLLLWKTPPGLELILAQEGVPFEIVKNPHPLSFQGGRFVVFDSQNAPAATIRPLLDRAHVLIDVDQFRRAEAVDLFEALIDRRAARASWAFGGFSVSEHVSRYPKARIRR